MMDIRFLVVLICLSLDLYAFVFELLSRLFR